MAEQTDKNSPAPEAPLKESMAFQAEVKQLLQLMIHSLYSNKEIVLRELISNGSDASDKLRFEALANGSLYENDSELKIRVSFDKEARTVSISDNGIGISEDKLNTIFHSFAQADMDISRGYGGAGLGLAISKGLILAQGQAGGRNEPDLLLTGCRRPIVLVNPVSPAGGT